MRVFKIVAERFPTALSERCFHDGLTKSKEETDEEKRRKSFQISNHRS